MARSLTYVDCVRLQRYVTLPMFFGGLVAPSQRFWPWLVRLQATAASYQFFRNVRAKYGTRAWSWFPFGSTLLVLHRHGIEKVLERPETFADPWVKKRALSRFTGEDAAIISREPLWKSRRNLNNEALGFGDLHADADLFASIVSEEVAVMVRCRRDVLVWNDFSALAALISQQVIFGRGDFDPGFADDLARLVSRSNWWLRRHVHYRRFRKRLDAQFDRAAQSHTSPSLVCRAARWAAKHPDGNLAPSSQAAFWCFVLKDAIELHTVRTLALIANAPADVRQCLMQEVRAAGTLTADAIHGLSLLEACIKEQLRLWTPVPILLRVAVTNFTLDGVTIRAGQKILLHTGFYHRDPEVFGDTADAFSPKARQVDKADSHSVTNSNPQLYVFSRYRQACAGQFLAIFLVKAVLAALLRHGSFELLEHPIDTRTVPAAIDQFALRFSQRPHDG